MCSREIVLSIHSYRKTITLCTGQGRKQTVINTKTLWNMLRCPSRIGSPSPGQQTISCCLLAHPIIIFARTSQQDRRIGRQLLLDEIFPYFQLRRIIFLSVMFRRTRVYSVDSECEVSLCSYAVRNKKANISAMTTGIRY